MTVVSMAKQMVAMTKKSDIQAQHERLLREFAKVKKIRKPEQWYKVTWQDLREYNLASVLKSYQWSLPNALKTIFPECYELDPLQFSAIRKREICKTKEELLDWLKCVAPKLGVHQPEDWYEVKLQDICMLGDRSKVRRLGSIADVCKALHPEFPWEPWKFVHTPKYYKSIENQREFMNYAAKQLNIQQLDDWYKITMLEFNDIKGGASVLSHYKGSLIRALQAIYPDHPWDVLNFARVPTGYWMSLDNQRHFLEILGKGMNITHPEQWLNVRVVDFIKKGGRGIMTYYNNSMYRMLKALYPDVKLERQPLYSQNKLFNIKVSDPFLSTLYRYDDIKVPEIPFGHYLMQYRKMDQIDLVEKLVNMSKGAKEAVPLSKRAVSKAQLHLYQVLCKMFADRAVHLNYKLLDATFPSTDIIMEVDCFVPFLSLAFEYQGRMHYVATDLFGDHRKMLTKDQQKRDILRQTGVTLIEVPYWWDEQPESLAASIVKVRPDIHVSEWTKSSNAIDLTMAMPIHQQAIVPDFSQAVSWRECD